MFDMLKFWLAYNVVWIPVLIYRWSLFTEHPELQESWWDNPDIFFPLFVISETIIFGLIFLDMFLMYRRDRRARKCIRLMNEAERLWALGRSEEAQWYWREATRLGQK